MLQESHWHSSSYCLQVSLLTLDKTACLSKAAFYVNVLPSCMYVCHVCPLLEEIIKGCKILLNWSSMWGEILNPGPLKGRAVLLTAETFLHRPQ